MQHRQHTGRRDQRDHRVDHTRPVHDHPAGGGGAVLRGVQQFVEGVVLDRGQFHGRGPLQVPLGRHPLHLGLQAAGGVGARGPQQCREQHHEGHRDQCGDGSAQPVVDRPAAHQPGQHAVDREQAHRLGRAPARLGGQHDPRGAPVGLPGEPETGRQQGRQPGDHGAEVQLQERVGVLVPAHVVAQRPAEEQPLRLGHLRRGPLLPHRRPTSPLRPRS